MSQHQWSNGDGDAPGVSVCIWCRVQLSDQNKEAACPAKQPRSKPPSIFDDLGAVGQRAAEIMKEEGRLTALCRVLSLVGVLGLAAMLSACAGLTGNIAPPPPQPTPASINATIGQLAAISADPVMAWQAGDYAVRAACDDYLNQLAERQAGFGLASGAVGTSGLAAAGMAASRANPIAAALATSASTLVQTFLGQLQNAGALPYSVETTTLIQNALDAYEGAVRPPQSLAEAAGDAEGAWWLCSPAGYAELAAKSIGSAQVSAAAMPFTAAMLPTSPSRPHLLINGR